MLFRGGQFTGGHLLQKYSFPENISGPNGFVFLLVLPPICGGADLSAVRLNGTDLSGANLTEANLAHADLWGACLAHANLQGANLKGANLLGTDLQGANLDGTNLLDAILGFPEHGPMMPTFIEV